MSAEVGSKTADAVSRNAGTAELGRDEANEVPVEGISNAPFRGRREQISARKTNDVPALGGAERRLRELSPCRSAVQNARPITLRCGAGPGVLAAGHAPREAASRRAASERREDQTVATVSGGPNGVSARGRRIDGRCVVPRACHSEWHGTVNQGLQRTIVCGEKMDLYQGQLTIRQLTPMEPELL